MLASTCTPEGWDDRCAVCGKHVVLVPSTFGDATCPNCGSLIWVNKKGMESQAETQADADALVRAALDTIFKLQRNQTEVEFWVYALPIVTRMFTAQGAAVWLMRDDDGFCLASSGEADDLFPSDRALRTRQFEALRSILASGSPNIIPPRFDSPWPKTLILVGLVQGTRFDYPRVIAVSQRKDAAPGTQWEFLRFLTLICERFAAAPWVAPMPSVGAIAVSAASRPAKPSLGAESPAFTPSSLTRREWFLIAIIAGLLVALFRRQ